MTNKAILPLLIVAALPQAGVLAAELLPSRALARIGDHRFYHGPDITCAVLSPDGRRIASAAHYSRFSRFPAPMEERDAYDPFIVLWDAATGERLRELRVPNAIIQQLAFSPDGKQIAAAYTSSDQKEGVVIFAVKTGKLLRQLRDFKSRVNYLQFSASGQQLRVSEWCGPVSAWDTVSGEQLRLWNPPPEVPPTEHAAGLCGWRGVLSPDNKVIAWEMHAVYGRGPSRDMVGLRVHDAATDKLLYQKKFEPSHRPPSFAFSANGQRFATDCDKLTIWETATGKELLTLNIEDMSRFALTPDGRQAVISEGAPWSSRERLWDLQSGKPSRKLSPDSILLMPSLPGMQQVFSADGKTLLLTSNSTLRLFDMTTGKEHDVPGHRTPVTPRFSADGRTLFTSCDEARRSWDVSPGKEPTLLSYEPKKAWEADCLAHSADNRLFLDRSEDRVRVRDTATGRVLRELGDDNRDAKSGQFSPDATRVLFQHKEVNDNKPAIFRIYEVKTGKASGEFKAELFTHPMFSPNGRLAAWADSAGTVHLHDAVSGKDLRTLRSSRPLPKVEGDDDYDLLFSPDGEQLILSTSRYNAFMSGEERETMLPVRVFQISSGREIVRFYANPDKKRKAHPPSCMACSPDGRLLAVAEYGSAIIRLLEIASGKVRAEFAGHSHGVHGLSFAPDGRTLASGGEDNVVFLWDVTGARTPAAVKKASESDLTAWWNDLASEDAKRAGAAIASLLRKSETSVAFLRQRLRLAETPDEKRLMRLLADLNSDDFETREAASRELARLGQRAEAALQQALTSQPPLEVKRRIENLLDKLEPGPLPPETLRTLRGIEVLEHLGTAEARQCLDVLAKGAPQARPTGEAKRALDRLANRR